MSIISWVLIFLINILSELLISELFDSLEVPFAELPLHTIHIRISNDDVIERFSENCDSNSIIL
jgi:hypothetical protein